MGLPVDISNSALRYSRIGEGDDKFADFDEFDDPN